MLGYNSNWHATKMLRSINTIPCQAWYDTFPFLFHNNIHIGLCDTISRVPLSLSLSLSLSLYVSVCLSLSRARAHTHTHTHTHTHWFQWMVEMVAHDGHYHISSYLHQILHVYGLRNLAMWSSLMWMHVSGLTN